MLLFLIIYCADKSAPSRPSILPRQTEFSASYSEAPFTEPTPNRGQRVLAHYAEVRRRKTKSKGVWGMFWIGYCADCVCSVTPIHSTHTDRVFCGLQLSPLYRTDANPRAESACTLCRGAKEEDKVKGGLGDFLDWLLRRLRLLRDAHPSHAYRQRFLRVTAKPPLQKGGLGDR